MNDPQDNSPAARARRISLALAGLLDDIDPEEARERSGTKPRSPGAPRHPYRPSPTSAGLAIGQARTRLNCPGCHGPMVSMHNRGMNIERCEGCGGMWLSPGELDAIVDAAKPPVRASVAELRKTMEPFMVGQAHEVDFRYRMCPRCAQPMTRRNFGSLSGVIIDECSQHGIYLDPGELEAVEAFVNAGGLHIAERSAAERSRRRAIAQSTSESAIPYHGHVRRSRRPAQIIWDALFRWWT